MNQIGTVEELASQIAHLKDNMTPGAHLLLVNAPGTFLRAQFAEEVLRILIQDSQLHVTILTMMPGQYPDLKDPSLPPSHMGATVRIFSPHPNELVLQGRLTSPGETTERV